MTAGGRFPKDFLDHLRSLEESYLRETDPIRQSGFGGGALRWRAEREPILDAIEEGGDLLDVGCANGHLLECLMAWGQERGLKITPHGLDCGARLIDLARHRLPQFARHFHVGNGWNWRPPWRYRYVYTLNDCVPPEYLNEYVRRLLNRLIAPGGRLILGAYGSRSRGMDPFDIRAFLESASFHPAGHAAGGHPPVTSFAWIDAPG